MKSEKGFTLVELMIVVAIIGILAAIAIPNFLKFNTKTKQSEARYNLSAIYSAEISYFGEYDTFSNSFGTIRWRPEGSIYFYSFTAGNEVFGLPIAGNPIPAGMTPAASPTSFTACAWGNIDNDPTIDQWTVNDRKELRNTTEDWRI